MKTSIDSKYDGVYEGKLSGYTFVPEFALIGGERIPAVGFSFTLTFGIRGMNIPYRVTLKDGECGAESLVR